MSLLSKLLPLFVLPLGVSLILLTVGIAASPLWRDLGRRHHPFH
jgi:hypothetical protein